MKAPIAIRLSIIRNDEILLKEENGEYSLPLFLCDKMETPQEGAKRELKALGLASAIISLPLTLRKDVSFFSEERKTWPVGAKTIPIVDFKTIAPPEYIPSQTYIFTTKTKALEILSEEEKEAIALL